MRWFGPSATVQSWRGMEGGMDAAMNGHNAIMSPTSHCYFDYSTSNINLEHVYTFEPSVILGGQASSYFGRRMLYVDRNSATGINR